MTFDKMSVWPVGYFRVFSSWILRNRREVPKRLAVINAELARIGEIKVKYQQYEKDGNILASENRIGISVTKDSSLGRLVQAYIARGGNPLDISPFAYPKGTEVISPADSEGEIKVKEIYPAGGVAAPISAMYNEPLPTRMDPDNPEQSQAENEEGASTGFEANPGGALRTDRYYKTRQRGDTTEFNAIVKTMHQIRSWANQDIKEMQRLEWQIIKLCDLREQLEKERDEILVQALGSGSTDSVQDLDPDRFNPGLQIQVLIQDMMEILYDTTDDGTVPSFGDTSATFDFLGFTFPDVPSESTRDALGC